jgi:hypothetical protein
MNHIETRTDIQSKIEQSSEKVRRDLRQVIKVINADYQQIDWEDKLFFNRVLTGALTFAENKKVIYVSS